MKKQTTCKIDKMRTTEHKTNSLQITVCNYKHKAFKMLALLFLVVSFNSSAQEDRKEKIEAMKVSFITQRLDLSSKEAQIFWPIYNEFQDKLQAARKAKRKEAKQTRNDIDLMSDADVETLIDAEIAAKQTEAELAKEYHNKFKQVLSVKKVAKLYRAEDDFKRELLKQLQNK